MKIYYSDQQLPTKVTKTIFLAGPTPRNNTVPSWRPEALRILKTLGFDGEVYIPEPSTGQFLHEYTDQIEWELSAMSRADQIVFWVPRAFPDMPALTTNVEFGKWIESGKIVFAYPDQAEKMRYLEYLAQKNHVPIFHELDQALFETVQRLGNGARRTNGETEVPLFIWNTLSFQQWYLAQKQEGNILIHAKLEYSFHTGEHKENVFLWILHVHVYIRAENRIKTNEFVLSRTNTSSVVMYLPGENLMDSEIVLVKEFRSPASTKDGFIWELPGGSSMVETETPLEVIVAEIYEETGYAIHQDRLKYVQTRQPVGTLGSHKMSLYRVELTSEEMARFRLQKNKPHGNHEDSEFTFVEVVTIQEIADKELVDWSNIGMILKTMITK